MSGHRLTAGAEHYDATVPPKTMLPINQLWYYPAIHTNSIHWLPLTVPFCEDRAYRIQLLQCQKKR